jgi:hypothetical protein
MIISHKHKFIFIKTAKTAGTSVEVFLSKHCGPQDILSPIYPSVGRHAAQNHLGLWNAWPDFVEAADHQGSKTAAKETLKKLLKRERFFNHIAARVARRRIPASVWNTYYKFSIERNPWTKTLSHYSMIKSRTGGSMTFDEYLEARHFCINIGLYTDFDGSLLVDSIAKYETLSEDLGGIFDRLGIPFDGSLGVNAKSEFRGERKPCQQMYDDRQREIIGKAFDHEISMHGYQFEAV